MLSFDSTIFKFTPNGTQSIFATGVGGVLAFDQSAISTHPCFTSALSRESRQRELNSQVVHGLSEGPNAMAFDANGNMFISQFNSGDIREITPTGTQSIFASGLNRPCGLAFDGSGNLFAAAANGRSIYEFTPAGVRSTFFQAPIGSGCSPLFLAFCRSPNRRA